MPTRSLARCAALLLAGAVCTAQAAPVLMISIDGMRPDYVTQADAHGLKIPALRRFLAEGAHAAGVTGVLPTVTYPSHTTLVTGAWPSEHGIESNVRFDPTLENQAGWYWYAADQKRRTLWQAADAAGLVTASVNWPVTVDAPGIRYNLPEYWRAGTPDDLKLLDALARPDGWLAAHAAALGPFVGGLTEGVAADETRTRYALAQLAEAKPAFMTVHLITVDGMSHDHGPFSSEANAALEAIDGMVGRLRDAALKNDPHAVVVVVSDHGFSRTDHHFNWRVPFTGAGLVTAPKVTGDSKSRIDAWQATLWPAGGSAAVMLHDPGDAATKAKVKTLLDTLAADKHNGIARVIDGAAARERGGWPDAAFVVELDPDYQFGSAWHGAVVTDEPQHGSHGYFPDRPEMRASLFVLGDGIARGRDLGLVDMRRIAPTVAALLGVSLPDTQPALAVREADK